MILAPDMIGYQDSESWNGRLRLFSPIQLFWAETLLAQKVA
jgi:hypothetical protein